VAAEGSLPGFGASAIIDGGGAVSTPTSSQLLYRVSPPRLAPLVFSIKQTAVPAGLLICGFLGPAMAGALGWRGAVLATATACVALAVMLQPLRTRFDDDRVPSRRFRMSDFRLTIASVLNSPDLRGLSFACFAFNGVHRYSQPILRPTSRPSAMSWLRLAFCSPLSLPSPYRAGSCGAGSAVSAWHPVLRWLAWLWAWQAASH
jgi:predicted MFS family arabinose efflux permease